MNTNKLNANLHIELEKYKNDPNKIYTFFVKVNENINENEKNHLISIGCNDIAHPIFTARGTRNTIEMLEQLDYVKSISGSTQLRPLT